MIDTVKVRVDNGARDIGILIVDDDSFLVKLLVKSLAIAGFTNVRTASTGAECLQTLKIAGEKNPAETTDIALVLSDIVLPDFNGFELCARIKRDLPDLPVILISGYDIQDINSKLVESGADDFLLKPFNTSEMITRVKMILGKKKNISQDEVKNIRLPIKVRKNYSLPYIGDRIAHYVIIDFLGWGRTTVVYKVMDSSDKTIFALKMLTRNASEILEAVARFENEISIMASVQHPNIIAYKDQGKIGGSPYIIMEYVDGMDLEELLITRGKIPEDELLNIAYSVAGGIAAIHRKNVIHRDIKLKNILYEHRSGNVKISDFGIAKMPESLDLTKEGFVLGTPLYMAPEALHGEIASIKTDIYSFGATIYHLIAGTAPFTADNSIKLAEKIKNSVPPPLKIHRPDLGRNWDSLIVEKCLSRDPSNRPSSMYEVMEYLDSIR